MNETLADSLAHATSRSLRRLRFPIGGQTSAKPDTDFHARWLPEYDDARFDRGDRPLADAIADANDTSVHHGKTAIRRYQDGRDVRYGIAQGSRL
jgi:hypothetical protein